MSLPKKGRPFSWWKCIVKMWYKFQRHLHHPSSLHHHCLEHSQVSHFLPTFPDSIPFLDWYSYSYCPRRRKLKLLNKKLAPQKNQNLTQMHWWLGSGNCRPVIPGRMPLTRFWTYKYYGATTLKMMIMASMMKKSFDTNTNMTKRTKIQIFVLTSLAHIMSVIDRSLTFPII